MEESPVAGRPGTGLTGRAEMNSPISSAMITLAIFMTESLSENLDLDALGAPDGKMQGAATRRCNGKYR